MARHGETCVRQIPDNVNSFMTNGFAHHYHLGEFTVSFRDIRCDFDFFIPFSMKFL